MDEGGWLAAVLRVADLAGKSEGVDTAGTRRTDELARDCATAREQVDGLRRPLGTLTGRADEIEQRLAEVSALLGRMSAQITALTTSPGEAGEDDGGYRVNQPPPWWKPADQRCQDAADR